MWYDISLPIFMVKELLVAVIILSEFKLQQIHSNIIIHLEMLPAIWWTQSQYPPCTSVLFQVSTNKAQKQVDVPTYYSS